MKYIIAPINEVTAVGITPARNDAEVSDYALLNENELRYRFNRFTLEEAAEKVQGIIVNRITALDYLTGRKSVEQIKTEIANE